MKETVLLLKALCVEQENACPCHQLKGAQGQKALYRCQAAVRDDNPLRVLQSEHYLGEMADRGFYRLNTGGMSLFYLNQYLRIVKAIHYNPGRIVFTPMRLVDGKMVKI